MLPLKAVSNTLFADESVTAQSPHHLLRISYLAKLHYAQFSRILSRSDAISGAEICGC